MKFIDKIKEIVNPKPENAEKPENKPKKLATIVQDSPTEIFPEQLAEDQEL